MKRERRDDAGRDATGKLVRHNGEDVQNLFVGTRVVVNFRVARDPGTMVKGSEMAHPVGAQQVSLAPLYGIYLLRERLVSKVNSSMKGGF